MKTAKKEADDFGSRIQEITVAVTLQQITDMMIGAIECNHMTRSWCLDVEIVKAEFIQPDDGPWYAYPGTYNGDFLIRVQELTDERTGEWVKHKVGPAELRKGLELMARKHAAHFADILDGGNPDNITADVFLQCVALGEVKYG